MKKRIVFVIIILLALVVSVGAIRGFVVWCMQVEKQTVGTKPTSAVTETVTPEVENAPITVEKKAVTVTPKLTTTTAPTITPTIVTTKEQEPTDVPVVEVSPTLTPSQTVTAIAILSPTVTAIPSSTVTPTQRPKSTPSPSPMVVPTTTTAVTPTPIVMPTTAPQCKYTYEAKMGDNVWYRVSEDGILYVMGTGATVRFDYTYDKETDRIYGGDYHYDRLMNCTGAKHIVIEEGITKLSSWSLMHLPNIQSITFPSSLQEIEDYCFVGTGRTIETVWIGLDKEKVKLGKDAFYGTVYQTEEDLRKPTPIPTLTPTPTSLPMEANNFYKALVEEAGIKIEKSDKEPYSAALVREGILAKEEVRKAEEELTNQEAALLLYRASQKFSCKSSETVVEASKKYDRISDKKGIKEEYRDAVYFCFGNGIMPGKNDGEYSHTRSFEPKATLNDVDGKTYCKRLFNPEERVPMSPDAQVIRTTNLPVQAKLYPYILESFPNVYYDTNYYYMYNIGTDDRAFPTTAKDSGFLETWCTPSTVEAFSKSQPERCKIYTSEWDYLGSEKVGMDKVVERYRDTWEKQAREYLELVFNFDYRTVREDVEWQNKIKNLNAFYHEWGKGVREGSCAGISGIDEWFDNFLDYAELNHTIVECSDIDFDMSTLFYSERFHDAHPYTIRVHLRYKITTDAEPGASEMAEVIPMCAYGTHCSFTSFCEWKDVYAELTFATNSFERTGIGGVRILEYNTDDAIRYHFDPKDYVK